MFTDLPQVPPPNLWSAWIAAAADREMARREAWLERATLAAVPWGARALLRRTRWRWLARLTGVEVRHSPYGGGGMRYQVTRHGRVVAERWFAPPWRPE